MKYYKTYVLPFSIAIVHGVLSVLGLSQGYEYYFWLAAILAGGILLEIESYKGLWISSFVMGFMITTGTGIPQALFIETYFLNNPEYVELGNKLLIGPRLYILLTIPVFSAILGLLFVGSRWIFRRARRK